MKQEFKPFIRMATLIIVSWVGLTARPEAPVENLLVNGDFSRVTDGGLPVGWRRVGTHPLRVAGGGEDEVRHLEVGIDAAAAGEGQIVQRLSIHSGHVYELSGQLRSHPGGLGFLQLKLYRGKVELKRINVGRSGTEWTEAVREIFVEDADRAEVLLRYFQTDRHVGGSVAFAELRLTDKGEKVLQAPVITGVNAVCTFQSAGLSLTYAGDPGPQFRGALHFRELGSGTWRVGADFVDTKTETLDPVLRVSLLDLLPGRTYEARCEIFDPSYLEEGPLEVKTLEFTTWTEDVPVSKVITLPPGRSTQMLQISDQGDEQGWIKYVGDPEEGSVLDVRDESLQAVLIQDAAYVILENVTLRGGLKYGVMLRNSHHIRIRRCDIAGWGQPGTVDASLKHGRFVDEQGRLINWQAGVRLDPDTSQIVVEDNYIHSPRGTANSWLYGHPAGPAGVVINSTLGNHVVRNNDIIGSERHWWNDAIEGMHNSRVNGGPYRDTDISGNILAFSNDDGTELDGGQINVRFFDNWVQWALCGVSCAPNMGGPSYVFRNLMVLGDERNKANFGFKMGGARFKHQGLSLLVNNTVVSRNAGLSTGHYGNGPSPIFARNNVIDAETIYLTGDSAKGYDMDHNLFPAGIWVGSFPDPEVHGVRARPEFKDRSRGDYRLREGSPGSSSAGTPWPGLWNDPEQAASGIMGAFTAGQDVVFPRRCGELSVSPLMTSLEVKGDLRETVSILRAQIGTEAGKRWEAHVNADWLELYPKAGEVTGAVQDLRLRADAGSLDVGLHRAAVTFRTDLGLNRTVFVSLTVHPANPFTLEIEAEAAAFGGNFVRKEDPEASGGAYVVPPFTPGRHIRLAPDENHGSSVAFTFDVPASGLYAIHARVRIPGPDGILKDSCYLSLNGAPPAFWGLSQAGRSKWNWQQLPGKHGVTGEAFELEAGRHTLVFIQRESGLELDKIAITNQP